MHILPFGCLIYYIYIYIYIYIYKYIYIYVYERKEGNTMWFRARRKGRIKNARIRVLSILLLNLSIMTSFMHLSTMTSPIYLL